MRIPISDKFLLDFYDFIEKAGDVMDIFSARPWREVKKGIYKNKKFRTRAGSVDYSKRCRKDSEN